MSADPQIHVPSVHAGHWSIDARGFMQTFGIFLAHLNEYLVEEKPFSNSGAWGEETKYFAPASVVVGAEAAGQPLSSLFPEPQPTKAPDTSAAASAPAPVMFLRPINLLDPEPKNSQQSYDIWLSETQTSAFREACRQRNLTVTQATTALMSLAELEWVMSFPMGETEEQKKAAIKGFKEATHVPSIWNIVDQRLKMGEYSSHEGEKGSPTMAADGFPLMMDMHVLRKAIKYDEATGQITRNPRDDVFWDSVVPMCRDAWKVNDMSWQGFLQREIGSQQMIPLFVGEAYMIPSLLSSSIGDAELCGFLTHVSPLIRRQREAKGEILDKHLVMDQLSFSVRTPTPLKMILVWQWNGRMMLRLHSSAKWTSEEGMKKFGQIFSEWIDMVA
ncbi:hypothetical protein VKT23_013419 [Stygiomarasmius scandens]|uniref:Uncharacterized protein n=1 Tax=Marasmiellus scandens TaxID=2682957 RepID=A0ABR1J3D2_9AGAR